MRKFPKSAVPKDAVLDPTPYTKDEVYYTGDIGFSQGDIIRAGKLDVYKRQALLYPVGVVFAVYSQYQSLKKEYQLWQREVIKDLPGLIDKLRISFASGKDFRQAFREARDNSGPKMAAIIDKLNNDLQYMRPAQALDLFANSFKMPAVNKFASAVKISIEYGYQQAESYFNNIEADITEVRRVAIEEITRSKPVSYTHLEFFQDIVPNTNIIIAGATNSGKTTTLVSFPIYMSLIHI